MPAWHSREHERAEADLGALSETIAAIAADEPFAIWGVGSDLREAAAADSSLRRRLSGGGVTLCDRALAGQTAFGLPVADPARLTALPGHVVLSPCSSRSRTSMRQAALRLGIASDRLIDPYAPPRPLRSFGLAELAAALEATGVEAGRTVIVHASWRGFAGFTETPLAVVEHLLDRVGPAGTLAMPAFPERQDPDAGFDVLRTPSGAGLLSELFRRWPGVARSINLNHSVCALGPGASHLTGDHHRSLTSWDENSPYYRLKDADALVVELGLASDFAATTALHCADSLLRTATRFHASLFRTPVTYSYRDAQGRTGQHTFLKRAGPPVDVAPVLSCIDPARLRRVCLGELRLLSVPAGYLIEQAVALARRGITHYGIVDPDREFTLG